MGKLLLILIFLVLLTACRDVSPVYAPGYGEALVEVIYE